MANYYATTRSNYFKVKDSEKFLEALNCLDVEARIDPDTDLCFLTGGENGWPSWDCETDEEIDFFGLIADHLPTDEVAIFIEIGNEKLRYLFGHSIAINSKGILNEVNLNEVYEGIEEPYMKAEY